MSGYFLVYRGMREHPLFQSSDPLSKYEAWLWLIERANFRPAKFRHKNAVYELPRGAQGASYRYLAKEWKWSTNRVIRELNLWQKQNMIELATEHGYLKITICNYDKYQVKQNVDGTATEQQRNTDGTLTDTQVDTVTATETDTNLKKERTKELKKESLKPPAPSQFSDLWVLYPKKVAKQDAEKAYNHAIKKGQSHEYLREQLSGFVEASGKTGTAIQFYPNLASWLNGERWNDDLTATGPGGVTTLRTATSSPGYSPVAGQPGSYGAPRPSRWIAEGDRLAAKYEAQAQRERQEAAESVSSTSMRLATPVREDGGGTGNAR